MYRTMLNGRIDYERPNSNLSQFNGLIKLNRDPKIHILTNDNFIPKGSIVKSAGW
jgi:hypothetical protein